MRISKSYYTIVCSECGRESSIEDTLDHAESKAIKHGWKTVSDKQGTLKHLCLKCAKSRTPSCKERIEKHLRSRLEDFGDLTNRLNSEDDTVRKEADTEMDELPLSVDKTTVYRVLLSWGGPSDFFDVECDASGQDILRITYSFQDWFDGASEILTGDEFDVAKKILQNYTGGQ